MLRRAAHLDVFSRYVVGWMVALREGAGLASKLIEETCEKQNIQADQLTIHADRGSSMRSKPVVFLLADLSITKTHSRPYTSNDNPYSESQFRTLKYRPEFPDRFGCLQDSRAFCHTFFPWYNDDHRHSGIGMMTPAMVHYGLAPAVHQNRQLVLDAAYSAHPDRFVRRPPPPASTSQGQRALFVLLVARVGEDRDRGVSQGFAHHEHVGEIVLDQEKMQHGALGISAGGWTFGLPGPSGPALVRDN